MSTNETEGWAFPLGARKAHYFVSTDKHMLSLCGAWQWADVREGKKPEPDTVGDGMEFASMRRQRLGECVGCRRQVDAR